MALNLPPVDVDIRIAEQLCSRLCHDLISPVSAISNGMELLRETNGSGSNDDITSLIGQSADSAARKLKIFRLAYGAYGNDAPLSELRDAMAAYCDSSRLGFEWDVTPSQLREGMGKIILNLCLLAIECLAGSGTVRVAANDDGCVVSAMGGRILPLQPDVVEGLNGHVDLVSLTPKAAHGFWTQQLAGRLSASIAYDSDTELAAFTLRA